MPVQSVDLKKGQSSSRSIHKDWTLIAGKVGVWLSVITFGGIFWGINGGFSVLGLEVIATSFNTAGRLFWAAIASITFQVPVQVAGLPATQPIVPWLGVIAASLLQIAVIYRKLRQKDIPVWLFIAAAVLSGYDMATTYFGLGTIHWIIQNGHFIQALIAFVLTFLLELTVSLMLKK